MLQRLRELGFTVQVYEAAADVGGTWYWNRYPGCRCDIESMEYSYSFDKELEQAWEWSERYATQPEILGYADHVADRFDLRRDIQFETRVTRRSTTRTPSAGRSRPTAATSFPPSTSCSASAACRRPSGRRSPVSSGSAGSWYHTGHWPHEGVDFSGQRVGVIGTGSSGIQSIPLIAEQAAHLTVFQRTPNFSLPAKNAPLDAGVRPRVEGEVSGAPSGGARLGVRGARTRPRAVGPRGRPGGTMGDLSERVSKGEPRRDAPGPTTTSSRARRPTTRSPSTSGTGSARSSTTPRSPRRSHRGPSRSAPSGCASTRTTSRRSTGPTSARSTCARPRSSRSPRRASARRSRSTSSTPSSSPPASTR